LAEKGTRHIKQAAGRSFLGTYFRLLGAVKPYAWQLAGAIACMIVLALATGAYAYVIGPMLKFLVTRGVDGGHEILSLVPGLDVSALDRDLMLVALPFFILPPRVPQGCPQGCPPQGCPKGAPKGAPPKGAPPKGAMDFVLDFV